MNHVSNKPDQHRHFMPLSTTVRNVSYKVRHSYKYLFFALLYGIIAILDECFCIT